MGDGLVPYWPGAARLRRALTSQLVMMNYPTVESHPWRPHTRPLARDL